MKNSNLLIIKLMAMLAMVAAAISIGSRRIESWKDGNPFTAGGLILLGIIGGWFLFFFMKRYLPAQITKLYSIVALSVLLGIIVWFFRPVLVTIPWESIKVEILNEKNAQSQGYEVNIVGARGWGGEKLALDDFAKAQGWAKNVDLLTGTPGGENLTIPGHLKDRGDVVIEFKATGRGGIVKVKTGYKEKIVDLYAPSDNVITVNVGKDFVNPIYLIILYTCDVITISLGILAILVFILGISKRLSGKSALPDRLMVWSAYLYLAVPLIMFAVGWLKAIFALFFSVAILFGMWKADKDFEYQVEDKKGFLKFFFISLLVASVWVYFSGIGGYTYQNLDFDARNAIFRDLINHSWPVIYDYRHVPEYRSILGDTAALIYYFPFWLPSALVGKAFGWLAGNNMLYIWTVLGVTICFHLVTRYTQIRKSWVLLVFVFWSGMDILGRAGMLVLASNPPYLSVFQLLQNAPIEWWTAPLQLFQYSAHTTQLFWVFNQSLPAWIATLLVLNQKKCRSILFTSALVLLYAPLPSLGLAPFVVYKLFENMPLESLKAGYYQVLSRIKEAVTGQNIISGGILFATALFFFSSNVGTYERGFSWELLPGTVSAGQFIYMYLLFCLVEFLPFVLLVKDSANRPLLILLLIILLILPLYKYGGYNDLAMRASIPALLILCLLFIQRINLHLLSPDSFSKGIYSAILVLVLLLSAVTPLHEILRSRDMLESSTPTFTDSWKTFDKSRGGEEKTNGIRNFVTGDPAEKLFFKTIGK